MHCIRLSVARLMFNEALLILVTLDLGSSKLGNSPFQWLSVVISAHIKIIFNFVIKSKFKNIHVPFWIGLGGGEWGHIFHY